MSTKRYTAADVKKIVGMDRNTLFYCVKTLGLIRPIQRMPKAILYDLLNLLDLALIQELLSLGITQGTIRAILNEPVTLNDLMNQVYMSAWKEGKTIWENYEDNRGVYEDKGCVLILMKKEDSGHSYTMMPYRDALEYLDVIWLRRVPELKKTYRDGATQISRPGTIPTPFGHVVIVDIFGLVNKVESLTGEKLGT